MIPFDAYTVYCDHQRSLGLPAPSREWWDLACKARPAPRKSDVQFDYDTEKHEGWAND